MKEIDKIIQNYLDIKTEYIFNKYVYAKFLIAKYYKNFGELEIEKLNKTYELFKIDKILEYKFITGMVGDEINEAYFEAEATYEFMMGNFRSQIFDLEKNNIFSKQFYDKLVKILNSNIKNDIREVLNGIDPLLNDSEEAKKLYKRFMSYTERTMFNTINKYKLEVDNLDRESLIDMEEMVSKTNEIIKKNKKVLSQFPFNYEKILLSEEKIENKRKELEKEVKDTNRTIDRLNNYYIMSKESSNWLS